MLRILAGLYKGRNLLPPPGKSPTRPITGAVKKSIFDILAGWLPDSTVVDLYCGTGTLGIEALSRGARRCFFADRDKPVLARLRRNLETVGAIDRCTIWGGDIPARLAVWLGGLDGSVDVAFVDPPYEQTRRWDWREVAETVFDPLSGSLAPDGLVMLRLPGDVEPPERIGRLVPRRIQRYGDMTVMLMAVAESSS
jgi:16S rRNA (guanine(966)-N(2))-methyltransferase RsmD